MEELSDLFQNLQSMKLNISSLSEAEKLNQAEKVVKTFWNAIGGDMSEFDESKLAESVFHFTERTIKIPIFMYGINLSCIGDTEIT
jgi:predicted SpoU family rRNA methylase